MVVKPVLQWKNPIIKISFAITLSPVSLLFFVITMVRNFWYDHFSHPAEFKTPIIGVGSLTAGGSGKTPLVEFIAMRLTRAGMRAAVVSNGYKKKQPGLTPVSDGKVIHCSPEDSGDEAFMMALNFRQAGIDVPVVSCADRIEAMQFLETHFELDVVILDDSFQYRKLKKNVEIVVQDFYEINLLPVLLPLGRRRDLAMSLKRAEGVVIAKTPETHLSEDRSYFDKKVWISGYAPDVLVHGFRGTYEPMEFLCGKKIILFSALGYPESFENAVNALCRTFHAEILRCYEFQDHHWYRKSEIQRMLLPISAGHRAAIALTTQKDMVKMDRSWIPESCLDSIFYLKCTVGMPDEDNFVKDILRKLAAKESQ
jgi:tetraacyldisaccharide 4'-kinase